MKRTISIGTDHGGFLLKEKVKNFLRKSGYRTIDAGTYSNEPCDYPFFGFRAAENVSKKIADCGIVFCKTGIGMSIIANKLPGIRAAMCLSREDAVSSRKHNNANILVLGAEKIDRKKAINIVKAWLKTKPMRGRHARRVKQIAELEKKYMK